MRNWFLNRRIFRGQYTYHHGHPECAVEVGFPLWEATQAGDCQSRGSQQKYKPVTPQSSFMGLMNIVADQWGLLWRTSGVYWPLEGKKLTSNPDYDITRTLPWLLFSFTETWKSYCVRQKMTIKEKQMN